MKICQKWRKPSGSKIRDFSFAISSIIAVFAVISPICWKGKFGSAFLSWKYFFGLTVKSSSKSSPPLIAYPICCSQSWTSSGRLELIGILSAKIFAPTLLWWQICARSDESPSLKSIIAVAIFDNSCPSEILGEGCNCLSNRFFCQVFADSL